MKTIHRVSAGGVVIHRKTGMILIVSQNNDSWSFPKGHVDPGEDLLECARREIREESGVSELEYVKDLGSYERFRGGPGGVGEDRSEWKTIHLFLFFTDQEDLQPEDPNNPQAQWISIGEVMEVLTYPKDKDFFRDIVLPQLP